MSATGTEARLCEMIAERQAKGIAKYGTTLEGNPLTLRQWLQHLLEEQLDAAAYTLRAIEEIDAADKKNANWVPWHGGSAPIKYGTSFGVRFRHGGVRWSDNPYNCHWMHSGKSSDIIAYCVLSE
jgi:hypothetical protein